MSYYVGMGEMRNNLETEAREYFPETQALIDSLMQDPAQDLRCSHREGSPAVGIYEVPRGCVALPSLETQLLCPQHRSTNGSFEGMRAIVDLSVDAAWSQHIGEEPDFCITKDSETGELKMVERVIELS